MAFSNTKTALAHSISYEMTLRYGLPHGIACSFTLPLVLGMAWGHDAARDRTLQRVFGTDVHHAQRQLREFLHTLDVKTEFTDYGVTAVEAEKMRADILAKRAKGVPATKLAEKYGVSTAYIYMIKE